MRTVTRFVLLMAIPAALLGGPRSTFDAAAAAPAVRVGPIILFQADSRVQLDLIRWAVDRYEDAGLRLPQSVLVFHDDEADCRSRRGYFTTGRVDLCTGTRDDAQVRDTLLHELAHAWTVANLTVAERAAFMQLRGLSSWDSEDAIWPQRGFEQVAEVISWTLGERILSAEIPDHEPEAMLAAYEVLTGMTPPAGPFAVA
ncbi:MAG TPA: hypothetical protein VH989_06560 [Actinomycetota bacterium]|jgi:hypothetical protein